MPLTTEMFCVLTAKSAARPGSENPSRNFAAAAALGELFEIHSASMPAITSPWKSGSSSGKPGKTKKP